MLGSRQLSDLCFAARAAGIRALITLRHEGAARTILWFLRSFLMPQRFVVFECELGRALPTAAPPEGIEVCRLVPLELDEFREGRPGLPVEFYYDRIYGLRTSFLTLVQGEPAKIDWVALPGEPNRYFDLAPDEAEIVQSYVRPEFRAASMVLGLTRASTLARLRWLQDSGFHREYARVARSNERWLRALERVGYRRIGSLTHFAFYCPRFRRRLD